MAEIIENKEERKYKYSFCFKILMKFFFSIFVSIKKKNITGRLLKLILAKIIVRN